VEVLADLAGGECVGPCEPQDLPTIRTAYDGVFDDSAG
jgi:hypothetical protein